ncbi:hypothetical protein KP696_10440 [Nocardia seriolae]|uniref:hypothetical protein n=1 Tax=Nocardia seriolae TaxID=37332 RepID=UPI00051A0B89|nr:hypothetical protein [Nocardia seriolae]MTJ66227.1 hypothetical protein [Nocardia seriolae]MTJ74461.1 hypothetical protein [Nocardia seriolae]MTJ85860.1 hypothetical protein [Nocardia seriolae]MTK29855.1 hypothetical protein [Nocardia seriolae]MTK44218.1 hypothetical protein [Nocardia seriolae]
MWISAIAALITAVVAAAAFFLGHSTAPSAHDSARTPGRTSTEPARPESGPKPAPPTSSHGTELITCPIDLAYQYGLVLKPVARCPMPVNLMQAANSGAVSLVFSDEGLQVANGRIAELDSQASYAACKGATRYLGLGQAIKPENIDATACLTGDGIVVAATIVSFSRYPSSYASLRLTVWTD